MPSDLKNTYNYHISESSQIPYISVGQTNLGERTSIYRNLLNNGSLVYGNKVHDLCKTILNDIIQVDPGNDSTLKIYPFKSTYSGILNDQNNNIYVSTAFIAQCSKVEHLYFGIAHQLYLLRKKAEPNFMKIDRSSTYFDHFSLLASFPKDVVNAADMYAFQICQRLQLNISTAIQAIEVLQYSHLPFEEKAVPNDYFNSKTFIVPTKYFDFTGFNFNKLDQSTRDKEFISRKNSLRSKLNKDDSLTPPKSLSLFDESQLLCRYQLVFDQLTENEPEKALYSIFLLENLNGQQEILDQLKAIAWLFIVKENYQSANTLKRQRPSQIDTPSGRFFILLNRFSMNAQATLALRLTTDLISKYPEKKEFQIIREELIQTINKAVSFPIDKFARVVNNNTTNRDTLTNDKYVNLEISKQKKDSIEFYLLGIPDVVSDSILFKKLKNQNDIQSSPITSMSIIKPSVKCFEKNKFNPEKSSKKTETLYQVVSDQARLSGVMLTELSPNNLTEQYNQLSIISRTIYQSSRHEANEHSFIPVDLTYYLSTCQRNQTDAVGSFSVESDYLLRPKGYHFTGLLLVPFPYMATDLVLGGNHTRYFNFIFDSRNGKFIEHEVSSPRTPVTKYFLKAKYYYLFNKISSQ